MPFQIAIIDDHRLVAAGIADLIRKFENYDVQLMAENGLDLLSQLEQSSQLPDIALVDVNMPEMDGFETTEQLRLRYPAIRVLVLSMEDREDQIIRMIRNGARGYLLKDCRPAELRQAFDDVMSKGFYYSDFLANHLVNNLVAPSTHPVSTPPQSFNLNDREQEFLTLACSELTYNEIADRMFVSPRTVEGYRDSVFQKLNVKTRVGMVLVAIKHRLVKI